MTNKYSELSDNEINIKVLNYLYPDGNSSIDVYSRAGIGVEGQNIFDFCKNYDSAMVLVIDNKFQLHPSIEKGAWIVSKVLNYKMSAWVVENISLTRAIAECFLLMKDAENNNDK